MPLHAWSCRRVVSAAALAVLACCSPPALAAAEPPTARADVGGFLGWMSEEPEVDSQWDQWCHVFAGGAEAGFYWTEHLRTLVDVARTSEDELSVYRPANMPGIPWASIYTELQLAHTEVGLGQQYQFFSNTWVHPFVGGGVVLDWERTSRYTPRQEFPTSYVPGGPPATLVVVAEESRTGPDTRLVVRPFVSGGAKFYITPSAFFRADVRWAGRGTNQVASRFGFGADF